MKDFLGYSGKRVVVTGCASGMGEAAARQLSELGAEVVGLDITEPSVAVKQFHRLDLADPESIDGVAETIGGPIHGLFNVAGISSGAAGPLRVVEVNFLGTRHLTEKLLPFMEAGSAVVSVSSVAAANYLSNIPTMQEFLAAGSFAEGQAWCEANPDRLVGGGYGFAKQAIIVYTMMQAVPLGARGIRINCIGPNATDTAFLADTVKAYGPEIIDRLPKPLGRLSQPEEQADALIYLNSEAASYVTGALLWTDGGYLGGVTTGLITAI